MQDHQKVHPAVDAEVPPQLLFKSTASAPPLHRYNNNINQVASSRSIPITVHSRPQTKKRGSCCKFICWTTFILFLFLLISIGILYIIFEPKLPKYSIDNLRISDFILNYDMTLYAKFNVKITAKNPNKRIGIYYEKRGQLNVWYTNTKLCQGVLPIFYQGHQNTTKLDVVLTGQTQQGSTLMTALQEQQQTGRVPLDLKVDVPVALKLGRLKLRKVRFLVGCNLVVDSLNTNNLISIKTSNCGFRFKL